MSQSGQTISFNGVTLGQRDSDNVRWSVTKFDGWDGATASTTQFTQRARSDGATASEGFLSPRFMTIEGHISAPSLPLLEAARDKLNAAVSLTEFVISVSESRYVLTSTVKRQGAVIFTPITDTLGAYSILVGAKDPLKYGQVVTSSTHLPSSSGGLVYPVTYPITYTGVSNSGMLRVTNKGNAQAPVWLRIDGPIPAGGWAVTNVGKKQSLTFSVSLALAAGEFITVDMSRREVLAQGQSARSGYVTSRGWFTLDPGDNDIAFSAANYSSTAQLTVTTKPAWA